MSEIAIRIERLGKRYRLGQGRSPGLHGYNTLRETFATRAATVLQKLSRRLRQGGSELPGDSPAAESIWALREISLEVKRGGVLGIIGRNGAGKSTLLKILSRITKPTIGRAEIHGRVGSLLEIGTGFHPELTGRENIYLNGAILGMRRAEIQRKFARIVEFAEIQRFLDTPVKRYSSGMAMRLAFSVAAHLEPEILLVDEVLAVGDVAFQRKCLGKVGEVAHEGRTVLFVSHNMQAVLALCEQALLLQDGQLVEQGSAADVVRHYIATQTPEGMFDLESRPHRAGDGSVRVVSLRVESTDPDGIIRSGSCLKFIIGYHSPDVVRYPQFVISIYDQMDIGIFVLHNEFLGGLPECLPPEGTVTCLTAAINLTPGRCVVHLEVLKGNVRGDYIPHAGYFDVEPDPTHGSIPLPPRNWALCLLKHRWWLNEH
jgi:lipopolysaccharide transport system ATP-binding protein